MGYKSQAQPDSVIIPDLEIVRTNAQNLRSAGRNRAFSSAITTFPTPPSGGGLNTPLIIAAAVLNVRAGGIFMGGVSVTTTGDTAAATYDYLIGAYTISLGTITLVNATKVGPGQGVGAAQILQNGTFVSSSATAGITGFGANVAVTQFDSGTQVFPTAGTTQTFSWSDYLAYTANQTVEASPAVGSLVVLTLSLTTSAAVVFRGLSIWLVEQP
jgi:hypothetical protein